MASLLRSKDLIVGAIFVALGLFFATGASHYPLGTASRMGPGYMPLLLGSALVLLGVVVAIAGWRNADAGEDAGEERPLPWRAMGLVVGAIVLFGLTVRGLGFIPTIFLCTFVTSQASRLNSIGFSLLLAATLTGICTLIFIFGLGVTVPTFGAWLR